MKKKKPFIKKKEKKPNYKQLEIYMCSFCRLLTQGTLAI